MVKIGLDIYMLIAMQMHRSYNCFAPHYLYYWPTSTTTINLFQPFRQNESKWPPKIF